MSNPRPHSDEEARAPASPPPPYPDADPAPREDQPLLRDPGAAVTSGEAWKPPPDFTWIELAIMSNVFLYGFDGTITAATYAVISSEFDAANTASWLTTSYLVTSTAFQPLYGRFSDIFGRRVCFFVSSVTFGLGCLGCGLARDVLLLNCMRALTGFGGGGLMTMATIVNSDMIPFRKRGMYQALQNGMFGFGAVAGASFGGSIADHIGWRWCFLLQVPVSVLALVLGAIVIKNPEGGFDIDTTDFKTIWTRVDYLFMLPLFFQVVLLDSATKAGARLAIPSLATPLGGLVAGIVMSHWGKLVWLVRTGAFFMLFGNALVTALQFEDSNWKYLVYIFPANLGQGIIYPAILFTTLASFDHADHAVSASTVYLVRSLGTVWGVAITSAIVQTTLSVRLPDALGDIPDKWRLINEIRHSVTALKTLPVEVRLPARMVYYEGIRYAFAASTTFAAIALVAALFASPRGLRSTHK
ncbi:hypothetical protein K4K61_008432 [Colletotrichum sp. SAR11_59]|nr:hypothetical protein K4K61_008432 [Colletotrichum sp. SAR11_59]